MFAGIQLSKKTLGRIVLALAALVAVGAGLFFLAPARGDVTIKVFDQFSTDGRLSARPRVDVTIIDGDGAFEPGQALQLEMQWNMCDSCGGDVWADHGVSMSEANRFIAKTFRKDRCYKVSVRESSEPHVIGNPIVLFTQDEGAVEVQCP